MRSLLLTTLLLLIPLFAYFIYEVTYWNKSYPNLSIGNIELGGLTKEQITQKLNSILALKQKQTFTFEIPQTEVKGFKLNPDLITYDVPTMVENVYQTGRQGNLIEQITKRLSAPFSHTSIELRYDFDEQTTDTLLADLLRPYEKEVLNSQIKFKEGEIFATVSKPGKLSNRDNLLQIIKNNVSLQSNITTAIVTLETKQPTITQENSIAAIAAAEIAISKPLVLREPTTQYEKTLNSNEIFNLLDFYYNAQTNRTEVQITTYKLAEIIKDLPSSLNTNPIEGKSQQVGNLTILLEQAKSGQYVDTQKLTTDINNFLFTPGRKEVVEIPITKTEPALTKAVANQYGIKELLATGTSHFANSSPARIQNIRVAAAKLNGYLIPPNTTFSMYQAIGNIEKSTGYTDSAVIKNGRTVPGVGGGVCQVSTTLFRAALNAGLPITERRPHSFRVSYYEQQSPVGLDAAVFFPDYDFKFRNDTTTHIAIQTLLDEPNTQLTFNFWGAKDDRQVTLSNPEVTDRKSPPPEVRIKTESVPQGIIRQTDFAAEGATVKIQRTITKNNQSTTETITSVYRPWQAVFLIGTGEL